MKSASVLATIKELEAERHRIDAALMALRAVNGNGGTVGPVLTIVGVTLGHLRRSGTPQTSAQLRQAISAAGLSVTAGSIQTILARRARLKKDIVKKGRGLWGLK